MSTVLMNLLLTNFSSRNFTRRPSTVLQTSVADPDRFDVDLDPKFHADADSDPTFFLARKRRKKILQNL